MKIINKIITCIKDFKEFNDILTNMKYLLQNKSIAVIGSAKNITEEKFGYKIDQNDLVVRFNGAPTTNFETFVGKKTDIIVCTNIFFVNIDRNLMLYENKDPDFIKKQKHKIIFIIVEEGLEYLKKNIYKLIDKSNTVIFFDNRLNRVLRFFIISKFNYIKKFLFFKNGKKLSSGLIFISILKILNKQFTYFGFDLNKDINNMHYYYYKPRLSDHIHTAHDFKMENKILKKLLNLKN